MSMEQQAGVIVAPMPAVRRRKAIPGGEWFGLPVGLVLLGVLQGNLGVYWGQVLVLFLINAILVMGFRLISTMGGWSFAHVAFAGLGAYTMALLTTGTAAVSFWLALLAGPCVAAAVAMLLAYPVLRTRQYNFFLATFAASAALQQSFIQFSWITGGNNGIAFIPRPSAVLGLSFDTARGFFILVLVITAIVAVGLRALDRSRIGRTIKAVAANEQLSESLGIDAWRYRTLAFVTGSTIAGLAGVLLASFNGIINPIDFGPAFMFKIVAAAIVGGTTTFAGPLLGLAYLTGLEELFRGTAEYIPLLWGVSVIAALLLTRGGLEAILMRAFRRPAGAASRGRGA